MFFLIKDKKMVSKKKEVVKSNSNKNILLIVGVVVVLALLVFGVGAVVKGGDGVTGFKVKAEDECDSDYDCWNGNPPIPENPICNEASSPNKCRACVSDDHFDDVHDTITYEHISDLQCLNNDNWGADFCLYNGCDVCRREQGNDDCKEGYYCGFISDSVEYGTCEPTGFIITPINNYTYMGNDISFVKLEATIKSGTLNIPILYGNQIAFFGFGKAENKDLLAYPYRYNSKLLSYDLSDYYDYMFITYQRNEINMDGSSYLVSIDCDDWDGCDFKDEVNGMTLASDKKNQTSFTIGDATIKVEYFEEDNYVNLSTQNSNTYFDRIYSTKNHYIELYEISPWGNTYYNFYIYSSNNSATNDLKTKVKAYWQDGLRIEGHNLSSS